MSSSAPSEPLDVSDPRQYTGSSPISRITKPFAEHRRHEVQEFGYEEAIHGLEPFQRSEDFIEFLLIAEEHLPPPNKKSKFGFHNFVQEASEMAKSMRKMHFPNNPLLVFKDTEYKIPRGHVTDTECRPDITAVFKPNWKDENTLWPCIQLAGEQASQASKPALKAASYLHYLLLARPDLHVAHGLLTDKKTITFLFGIGGYGIRSFEVPWTQPDLYRLIYAFVYRLYEPGHFADPSYVEIIPNWEEGFATYTVHGTKNNGTKTTIECRNFESVYASNPFGTRTHILSNPHSKVKVDGKPLTVLKDQVCRRETRFDEYDILAHVHSQEKVPGVVEAAYHEFITIPLHDKRKHRIGLVQLGRPFSSITTLQEGLEVLFDTLEVIRYLRVERDVLHRDISRGNVLYIKDETLPMSDAGSVPVTDTGSVCTPDAGPSEAKEVPLCFIKYLLGKSNDPRKTSTLLLDFNRAEHLKSNEGLKRAGRTGTPVFIARAVELGHAVPLGSVMVVPAIPNSPEPYALRHPDRIEKFPPGGVKLFIDEPVHSGTYQWRHELEHDAESVFWLLFFWVTCASPVGSPEEGINHTLWGNITGSIEFRIGLIDVLSRREGAITHSVYRPMQPLLAALASTLAFDRFWLEKSDRRNDPAYVCEAFQRLILQFLLKNRNEEFLRHDIAPTRRKVEAKTQVPPLTETSGQSRSGKRTRSSSEEVTPHRSFFKKLAIGHASSSRIK